MLSQQNKQGACLSVVVAFRDFLSFMIIEAFSPRDKFYWLIERFLYVLGLRSFVPLIRRHIIRYLSVGVCTAFN